MGLRLDIKEGNSMFVGTDVEIRVTSISTDESGTKWATLLIDAPPHICVDRYQVRKTRIASIMEKSKHIED